MFSATWKQSNKLVFHDKADIVNILANNCLFTHPLNKEKH